MLGHPALDLVRQKSFWHVHIEYWMQHVADSPDSPCGVMTSSNLTLLIVLYQIRERFEVDSFIHDFECHSQRRNDPEQGVDRHVFTGFQVNNRFTIALGFVRQLLLAIAFSTAQQAYSLAEGWGIQNQHNVTYIGLLQIKG